MALFWCVLPARNRQTKVDTKFWYANVWNITLRTAQPRNTGPNKVTNFRAPELTRLFSWQCCAFEFGRQSKRATALVPDKLHVHRSATSLGQNGYLQKNQYTTKTKNE